MKNMDSKYSLYSLTTYFIFTIVVLYILNVLRTLNNRTPTNFPPGPKCLPVIGDLHIFISKNVPYTLMELSKKYGSVFSVQMGWKKTVVLTGFDTVRDALVNHADEFGERAIFPIFENMDNGMGLSFSHGDNWKAMRRFTISTLRDFGMGKSTIEETILDESGYLVQRFESFKGKPFDNTMIMNAAVGNIIVTLVIGCRMDYEDPKLQKLIRLTNGNIRLLSTRMISLYNIFPVLGFLPGSHKHFIKIIEEMFVFIRKTFEKHRKDLDMNNQRCFIDAFLARQKKEEKNAQSYFHNDNMTKVIRTLFNAGIETTSTTLRWGLLLMMKYPDIQEKVQEEIARVIGSAQPTYNRRAEMPYTNAVIHEIQRFADIVPMNLPHATTKDVTFKGYFIPKGTYIIPLLSSVLKDKTQFKNPDAFDPNNFLDSGGQFVKNEAFMPFSAGRRVCAGETLARMELFIFFTTLLQKFTICPPPGVTDVELFPGGKITTVPLPHAICAISRI
ncbi:cytochrome P450 2K1-like [Discoglossus pictus]